MELHDRIIVEGFLIEAGSYSDKAEALAQLGRDAIKEPTKIQALLAGMRKLKIPGDVIKDFFKLFKGGNRYEIVASLRDISCNHLGRTTFNDRIR